MLREGHWEAGGQVNDNEPDLSMAVCVMAGFVCLLLLAIAGLTML